MGQAIKALGAIWVTIGALIAAAIIAGTAQAPYVSDMSAGVYWITAAISFVTCFLVPGGMMYCVGDLHHRLIAAPAQRQHATDKQQREVARRKANAPALR